MKDLILQVYAEITRFNMIHGDSSEAFEYVSELSDSIKQNNSNGKN